jgi:hypothetical protein
MPDFSVADVDEEPRQERVAKSPYRVLYDGQCEICHGSAAWLKTLDLENKTICLPVSAEVLANLDSRRRMDDCLRQLHARTHSGTPNPRRLGRRGFSGAFLWGRLLPSDPKPAADSVKVGDPRLARRAALIAVGTMLVVLVPRRMRARTR